MSYPRTSIVIPAFNEASRIGSTLDELLEFFRSGKNTFEILVVDDGSSDGTAKVVEERGATEIKVLRIESNRGKGAAVRRGVGESRGELVLVCDADLAIPIEHITQFEHWLENGYSIACGSRGLPESRALTRLPVYRKRMGKIFNWMVRATHLTRFKDTQCGFKLFKGAAARDIFSRCRVDRFAYDVESLRLAERLGYRVVEVPITWRHVPESRVHPVHDAARMFVDLVRIRFRTWIKNSPPGDSADP